MEGEFDGFDDLDDDLLRTLPLDFPFDTADLDCVAAAEQVEEVVAQEQRQIPHTTEDEPIDLTVNHDLQAAPSPQQPATSG